jgi:hypothetical protein
MTLASGGAPLQALQAFAFADLSQYVWTNVGDALRGAASLTRIAGDVGRFVLRRGVVAIPVVGEFIGTAIVIYEAVDLLSNAMASESSNDPPVPDATPGRETKGRSQIWKKKATSATRTKTSMRRTRQMYVILKEERESAIYLMVEP